MSEGQINAASSPYYGLLYSIFQQPRERQEKGLVVAVTSACSGEGVSYVTRRIADQLEEHSPGSVLLVNISELHRNLRAFPENLSDMNAWRSSWQYRRDCIARWRGQFEYVIMDCPSLAFSGDATGITRLVDGTLLVVEANRTRKQQLQHAERQLQLAGGNVIGYILNKRRYLVPGWIYRHL